MSTVAWILYCLGSPSTVGIAVFSVAPVVVPPEVGGNVDGNVPPGVDGYVPPGEGGYVNQEDSFISGKEVVVGKAFSCHSRSDIVKCVNCFGGKVKRIFCRDDIGEYRL